MKRDGNLGKLTGVDYI